MRPVPQILNLPSETEIPGMRADARRNRERILEAAHRAFAAGGLEVSIDDIASEAGVGVGTVYRHFATKEDLVIALTERHFYVITGWAAEALTEDDPWQAIVNLLNRVGEMQAADRGFINSVVTRPEMADVCAAKCGLVPLVDELVDRARSAGVIRPEIESTDLALIVRSVGSAAEMEARDGMGSWRRTLEILLDGIRNPTA